jgi:hypothetical protein
MPEIDRFAVEHLDLQAKEPPPDQRQRYVAIQYATLFGSAVSFMTAIPVLSLERIREI